MMSADDVDDVERRDGVETKGVAPCGVDILGGWDG